jgi:hypothetical protein
MDRREKVYRAIEKAFFAYITGKGYRYICISTLEMSESLPGYVDVSLGWLKEERIQPNAYFVVVMLDGEVQEVFGPEFYQGGDK